MNLRLTANKLQMALSRKGRYIRLNQKQSYSEKLERMVTKYMLVEKREIDGQQKDVTIIESYRMVDIVMTLADIYGGGG